MLEFYFIEKKKPVGNWAYRTDGELSEKNDLLGKTGGSFIRREFAVFFLASFSGPWMVFFENLLNPVGSNFCINLGGGYVGMTEHLLN